MTPSKERLLNDPTVRDFTKDIIRKGFELDPVDSYYDCKMALQVLRARMRNATEFDWDKARW